MWDRYHNVSLMLAAYNAGPGRANDYAAGRRSLPAETVNYVAQIAPGLGMASIASPAAMPTANAHPWRQATLFTPRGDGEASSTDGAVDVQPQRTQLASPSEIGRPHASTTVTTAMLVCRLLLEQKNKTRKHEKDSYQNHHNTKN